MKNTNEMEIRFESRSTNEGFARVAVASFMTQLNPVSYTHLGSAETLSEHGDSHSMTRWRPQFIPVPVSLTLLPALRP